MKPGINIYPCNDIGLSLYIYISRQYESMKWKIIKKEPDETAHYLARLETS